MSRKARYLRCLWVRRIAFGDGRWNLGVWRVCGSGNTEWNAGKERRTHGQGTEKIDERGDLAKTAPNVKSIYPNVSLGFISATSELGTITGY